MGVSSCWVSGSWAGRVGLPLCWVSGWVGVAGRWGLPSCWVSGSGTVGGLAGGGCHRVG